MRYEIHFYISLFLFIFCLRSLKILKRGFAIFSKLSVKILSAITKKANVKIATIFKSTGPLCYGQQDDKLALRMKAFKITKDELVSTVANIRKITVNSRSVLLSKRPGRHAE
jgi:hypothetical protein